MQQINVNDLRSHPKNDYFFDDIMGDNWKAFLESVKTSGVIEPIIVEAKSSTIISGHQRVRACKELGIQTILCENRIYDEEDKILKDLLETNLRQRGLGNTNPIKLGRCLLELERIYGIRQGSAGKVSLDSTLSTPKTQEDLISELGMNKDTYLNYKKLTTLIPELQNLVENDTISPSVASRVISKLSDEQQQELIENLDVTKKLTQNQVQEYIDKMEILSNKNAGYELKLEKVKELELQLARNEQEQYGLKKRITELAQEKVKTEIITQEKDNPETLKQLSDARNQLNEKSEQYQKLYNQYISNQELLNKAMGESTNWQLTSHCSEITKRMLDFISEMGKYGYMAESFNEIPNATRMEYLRCIKAVQKWSNEIVRTIEENNNIINIKGE